MNNHLFGLSPMETATVRAMAPEVAAHNIALAYVLKVSQPAKLEHDDDADLEDVLSMASQYVQAYNFAYNYVLNENKLIDEA